jgi:predicted MFS family arabinose efflux permease
MLPLREHMRIAKPILLVSTPIGVVLGLYEGYRLAGGLVVLMAAMLGLVSIAAVSVIGTIRREQREERERLKAD